MSLLPLPQGYHWDTELRLGDETIVLMKLLWPNYIVEESDIPEPGLSFEIDQEEFLRRFPVWGIRHSSTNELVAYANAAQLAVDTTANQLPDQGWRFAIDAAARNEKPNCLCLLVANIHPSARGVGLGKILIERAKLAAKELQLPTMIAPVRPTLKPDFPELPITDYLAKRTASGDYFDPWLSTHVKLGAEVLNICSESVQVRASVNKWREWTGLVLDRAGPHPLPQGLAPLLVDLDQKTAVYFEPNIWVRYRLS